MRANYSSCYVSLCWIILNLINGILFLLESASSMLVRVRSKFVEKTSNPLLDQLLDNILEDGILNDGERESIVEENKNRADKARCLIDTVRKKGDLASNKFIRHLQKRDPMLFAELGLTVWPGEMGYISGAYQHIWAKGGFNPDFIESQTDVVLWHWNTEIGSIRLWLWLMPLRLCLISTHCCLAPCFLFFFLPLPDFSYLCFYPQEETKTSWTLIPTAETLWNKEMCSEHAHLSSSLLFKAIISTWMITSKDTILYLKFFFTL